MKKITSVSLFSLLFLGISSFVAYMLKFTNLTNKWICLLIGVCMLVVSGIISIIKLGKIADVICFTSNAVALGFCIRTWYIFREFDNSLGIMMLVSLACLAYLLVFYLLLYIPFFERHYGIYMIIFMVLTLIGYIIVIATTKTTFVSTFGFYVIIECAFIFAMSIPTNKFSDLFRNILISTYSVFIVAIIICIMMLAGEGMDFDFSGDFSGSGDGLVSPKEKKKLEME